MVCSGPGPCISVPLDGALGLGGLGFGLGGAGLGGGMGLGVGGQAFGDYKPQIYKILPEGVCSCCCRGCEKKRGKKKKERKSGCKCGCKRDEVEDGSRLRYIPDAAMQLVTMLPV